MDKRLQKYILMNDRVGEHIEKGWLRSKSIPTQLLRGDIFEALPESEQPHNPEVALRAISTSEHSIKLTCSTLEVSKITDSEADLLLAITSREERFRSYKERNRLDKGKSLNVGSKVFVKVKSSTKELPGVIWYIGPLPTFNGTLFGVELVDKESEGCGTCDGTYRNKRYFTCPQDRGVFVAMDKLRPRQDQDKSPKKETTILSTLEDIMPSFSSKDTGAVRNMAKEHKLKIGQRVVVFPEKSVPLRGTVRYISEKINSDGDCPVGIELDKRKGSGTGMFNGKQRFLCKPGFALFAPVTIIIPEEEYHPVTERLAKSDGLSATSLSYLEANSGFRRNENEGFKRSNSATSISSKSSEEAFAIAGGKDQNKEKLCEEQTKILKDIKARQISKTDTSNYIDGTEEPVQRERMSFYDEHFQESPEWISIYYQPWPSEEEIPHGIGAQMTAAHTTSSTDSSQFPSRFYAQESINSSGGLNQYKATEAMQNDIEMRDHQLGAGVVHGEDRSKPIDSGLEVGSMVEVPLMGGKGAQYGVIRWIGILPELHGKIVAGLELETEQPVCSDGVFGGKRYFTCLPGRAFFVYLENCKRDSRFQAESPGTPKFSGREDPPKNSNAEMQMLREEIEREKAARVRAEQQLSQEMQQRERTVNLNHELEESLQEKEQEKNELQAARIRAEQQLSQEMQQRERTVNLNHELEESLQEKEQEKNELQAARIRLEEQLNQERQQRERTVTENQELEERLQTSEQQRSELQATLSTAQQALEEYRSARKSSDWVLYRDEIVFSDTVIGVGGWGKVMEGTFRGCQVAVKQIHDLILSPHNRRLFEREMSIASRCRHPCLLQFIGATNDDQSPLFVTELLDTSLRAVLHERALDPMEITTIALDVAKGLNYLHLSHPAPIIHRDISSANVLLWKHGTQWRGKVSDYGTANFMQHSMTVSPGAVIYSAPEAQTSRQSPKVDSYSFGVLLCEMNIRELPVPEHRNEQVVMVTDPFLRDLIRSCLKPDPEERPDMRQIISLLENKNVII